MMRKLISLLKRISLPDIKSALRKRSVRYGAHTALRVLIVLVIVAMLGALSVRHSKRFDLTANKRYSLADQSIKVLKGLDKDVKLIGFFGKDQVQATQLRDLAGQYAYNSRRFSFEIVDPDRNPTVAKRYDVTSYGTIVIESGNDHRKVFDASEQEITNAIIKVTRGVRKKVYFLAGHDELSISDDQLGGYSVARKALEDENYKVDELVLLRGEGAPEDAAVLIMNGPAKDLLDVEIERIDDFIKRGGSVFIMVDPESSPKLKGYLSRYGVSLGDDMVVDRMSRIFGADFLVPVVTNYRPHKITADFRAATFFPVARSVEVGDSPPEGVQAQPLAMTSDKSWAEKNLEGVRKDGKAAYDEGEDEMGPIPIAVAATIDLTKFDGAPPPDGAEKGEERDYEARMAVFGDSEFANNNHMGISGNGDLFMNTVNWLAEEEDLISIRPKPVRGGPIALPATAGNKIFWLVVVAMPSGAFAVGIIVGLRRRSKK